MKKLIFLLMILTLVGCSNSNESISLKGESDNWKGEYIANINISDNSEEGTYTFVYKDGNSNINFKNLKIDINDGETDRNEEDYREEIVQIPRSCSGCSVTNKSIPIKVTIKWDNKKEETFYLK